MSWKLAPSLAALFAEINATWPARDRSIDGTVGDTSHAARKSEHNPNRDPNDDVPDGLVTAVDIDRDGIDVKRVINALISDHRTWYVIYDRKIYSRTYGFKARNYTGSNPHTSHLHVSLMQRKSACADTGSWGIYKAKPGVKKRPSYARLWTIAHNRLKQIRALKRRSR